MTTQTVYLRDDTVAFAALCETCFACEDGSFAARSRAARIEGVLRADVHVGFRTCRRGHRIRVKRIECAR